MKTFRPGEVARAEDVNANFNEIKQIADAALPAVHIRSGKISVSSVPRAGFQNFTVTFDTPMTSANYNVILTIGGSGRQSPELMKAVYKTDNKRTTGFEGRIRNDGNSSQSCEVSYLVFGI